MSCVYCLLDTNGILDFAAVSKMSIIEFNNCKNRTRQNKLQIQGLSLRSYSNGNCFSFSVVYTVYRQRARH